MDDELTIADPPVNAVALKSRIAELEQALGDMLRVYEAASDSAPHRIAIYIKAKRVFGQQ